MKFSIVTPSFNQGQFVGESMDSVLNQRGDLAIQYFVLDNNSTDSSWSEIQKRVQSFKSDRILVSTLQDRDEGQADAINRGFAMCDGEIFAFLNSDDIFEKSAFEKVSVIFNSFPDVDIVYGKARFIDKYSSQIGTYVTFDFKDVSLCSHCYIAQPATFFRRSAFKRLGLFNSKIKNSFDYEYWLRAKNAGLKFYCLQEFLASTRLHKDTKSFNNRSHIHLENFIVQLKYCNGISDEIFHQYLLDTSLLQRLAKYSHLEKSQFAVLLRRLETKLKRSSIVSRLKNSLADYF